MKKLPKILLILILSLLVGVLTANRVFSQGSTVVRVDPPTQSIDVGQSVSIDIYVDDIADLAGFDITISYDSSLLTFNQYQMGGFLTGNVFDFNPVNSPGTLQVVASRLNTGGDSGSGILLIVEFQGLADGASPITLNPVILNDSDIQSITHAVQDGEVVVGVLSSPSPSPSPSSTPPPLGNATFQLNPGAGQFYIGTLPAIEVWLNSPEESVMGADLILNFDPVLWEVADVSTGSIFPNYPWTFFDNTTGEIRISGTASIDDYFSGSGVFSTITFNPLTSGQTELDFVYNPGQPTLDCNIIAAADGSDLLIDDPVSSNYDLLIANPVLNFSYNLPYRLESVGNTAEVEITTTDQTFSALVNADITGYYDGLSLSPLVLGQRYSFVAKIPGHLRKKADQDIILSGADNPETGYLEFGDLNPGDLNNDDIVNNIDLTELFTSWDSSGPADFNADGTVNNYDVWIMFDNFFKQTQL